MKVRLLGIGAAVAVAAFAAVVMFGFGSKADVAKAFPANTISLDQAVYTVNEGETFHVQIIMNNAVNAGGYSVEQMPYSTSQLEVVNGASLACRTGFSPQVFMVNDPDFGVSFVCMAAAPTTNFVPPAPPETVLFDLEFRCNAAGTYTLDMDGAIIFNQSLQTTNATTTNDPATVNCLTIPPTNTPTNTPTATNTFTPTATYTATPVPSLAVQKWAYLDLKKADGTPWAACTGTACLGDGTPEAYNLKSGVNLWVCTSANAPGTPVAYGPCTNPVISGTPNPNFKNGQGSLTFYERLLNGSGTGVAAWEIMMNYDHKLFALVHDFAACKNPAAPLCFEELWIQADNIPPAGDLDTDPDIQITYGFVSCSIVERENDVSMICLSGLGFDPTGAPYVGNKATQGDIAQMTIQPLEDATKRIKPSRWNGVTRWLLDQNCEVADYLGNPLPGSVSGGLVPTCDDACVTVRRLECDLNADCKVNITDWQVIGQKYGTMWGSLLYDPFFDLEPYTGDFDIDIKDLQFCYGRAQSTCLKPVPPEQATPQPCFNVGP